jgi:hypothetical protein
MFNVGLKSDTIFLNNCLVENLQKDACGGSVLSTGCGGSSDLLQLSLFCASNEESGYHTCGRRS